MSFKNAVLNTPVEARTWNGMKAYKSTLNSCTDLFFKIGASRGKDITQLFSNAYSDNKDYALRIVQWARDIRHGAGERELFRQVLKWLEANDPNTLIETKLLDNVSELGRWDDLLIFKDARVKGKAYSLIYKALVAGNGLCAKWMPRKGPIALDLRLAFNWSPKYWRKRLVELTNVVESKMCSKDWSEINFSHVPSLAMSRYSKAFGKNAPEEFTAYKEALKKGDPKVAKVNAGAVYPYDVVKNVKFGDSTLADEQWKALPNYIGDASILPIVDVSGSMSWTKIPNSNITPMDVAVSLGLYCAEKNTGPFKDVWLNFSDKAQFVVAKGNTLSQRLKSFDRSDWGGSTNLHAAFNGILDLAVKNKLPASDMPQILLIMSDMQFNCCTHYDDSAIEMIRRKYESAGYAVPSVVFWNLNAADNVPVKFDERGTALVSGFSPTIMKAVLSADVSEMTPEGVMLKTIMNDRYSV